MKYKFKTFLAYGTSYYLLRPWEFFIDLFKEVRSFFQRGWRGYVDSDLWGFDWYLRLVLVHGLKQFRSHIHSYPGYGGANTPRKWKAIVKKIESGFKAVVDAEENYPYTKKALKAYKEEEKSFDLLKKWFGHLWD